MKKALFIVLILSLLVIMAAACGGGSDKAPSGGGDADVAAGKDLFQKAVIGQNPGCVTCHSTDPGKTIVGPSLAGIASKGEDFIRQSIVEPDADVTEGFPAGTMPQTYKNDLSDQEINQLVKYLMTLN